MPLRLWARRRARRRARRWAALNQPPAKAEKSRGGATVTVLFGTLRWWSLGNSATPARFAIARPASCAGERKRNVQDARCISTFKKPEQ